MRPYKRPTPEAILTRQIRHILNISGIWHYKQWQGIGSHPGVSDIVGIYKGKPLYIEIKAPNGKLSHAQDVFLHEVIREGGIAIEARSIDDVIYRLNLQDKFVEYRKKP